MAPQCGREWCWAHDPANRERRERRRRGRRRTRAHGSDARRPATCDALHDLYCAIDAANAHGEPLTVREGGAIVTAAGVLICAPEDVTPAMLDWCCVTG